MKLYIGAATLVVAVFGLGAGAYAAADPGDLADSCSNLYGDVFGAPNGEPLGACQGDIARINASEGGATGRGVTVDVIDSGVDLTHPPCGAQFGCGTVLFVYL